MRSHWIDGTSLLSGWHVEIYKIGITLPIPLPLNKFGGNITPKRKTSAAAPKAMGGIVSQNPRALMTLKIKKQKWREVSGDECLSKPSPLRAVSLFQATRLNLTSRKGFVEWRKPYSPEREIRLHKNRLDKHRRKSLIVWKCKWQPWWSVDRSWLKIVSRRGNEYQNKIDCQNWSLTSGNLWGWSVSDDKHAEDLFCRWDNHGL